MRAEHGEGCCLVGNLASLLGDPVEPIRVALVEVGSDLAEDEFFTSSHRSPTARR